MLRGLTTRGSRRAARVLCQLGPARTELVCFPVSAETGRSDSESERHKQHMSLQLLRRDKQTSGPAIDEITKRDQEDVFAGIRCPRCNWRPSGSSLWCCDCKGTPEPVFESCGTIWNTFSTRGRCPGCSHQWLWTSCLRCRDASLHESWYELKA